MTDPSVMIAVEVADTDVVNEIRNLVNAQVVRGKAFDGSSEVITLLITVAPAIVAPLATLLQSVLDRRRHVRIVYKGTEIQGVSEAALLKILESMNADGECKS